MRLNRRFAAFLPVMMVFTTITLLPSTALASAPTPDHSLQVERVESGYRITASGPTCANNVDPLDSLEVTIETSREELMWHYLEPDGSWRADNVHFGWGNLWQQFLHGPVTLPLFNHNDGPALTVSRSISTDSGEVEIIYSWSSSDYLDFATALKFDGEWNCPNESSSMQAWFAIPKLVLQVKSVTYSSELDPRVQFEAWQPQILSDPNAPTYSSLVQVDDWENFFSDRQTPTCEIDRESPEISGLVDNLYQPVSLGLSGDIADFACQYGQLNLLDHGVEVVHIVKHPLTAAHRTRDNSWDLSGLLFDFLDVGILPRFSKLETLENGDTAFVAELTERRFLNGEDPIQLPALAGVLKANGEIKVFRQEDENPQTCDAFSPPIGSSNLQFASLADENAFAMLGENVHPIMGGGLMFRIFAEDPAAPGTYRCSFGFINESHLEASLSNGVTPAENAVIRGVELKSIDLDEMSAEIWVLTQQVFYSVLTKMEVDLDFDNNSILNASSWVWDSAGSMTCGLVQIDVIEDSELVVAEECSSGETPITVHFLQSPSSSESGLATKSSIAIVQNEDLSIPNVENFSLVELAVNRDHLTALYFFGSSLFVQTPEILATRIVRYSISESAVIGEPSSVLSNANQCSTESQLVPCQIADLVFVEPGGGVTFLANDGTLNRVQFSASGEPSVERDYYPVASLGEFPSIGQLLVAPFRRVLDSFQLEIPQWAIATSNDGEDLFFGASVFQVQRLNIFEAPEVEPGEDNSVSPPAPVASESSVSAPTESPTQSPTESPAPVSNPHVPVPNINFRWTEIKPGATLSFNLGRRQLDSIEISGFAIAYQIVDRQVIFELPKQLAPGTYDLRIVGSFGTVTYQQAITILSP